MKLRVAVTIAYLVLVALASYYFTSLWFELNYEYRGAPWDALIKGSAATPFQYRMLIPWLVRTLTGIRVAGKELVSARSLLFWIQCGSTFLLVLAFRAYLRFFMERRIAGILSMSVFLALPYNLILDRVLALRYPYDIPSILFFTLGLIVIYRKNWLLFYPLFIISTFNRETSCFLTVICFSVAVGREKWSSLSLHVLAQLLIWCAIKRWLYLVYLSNPGDALCLWNIRSNIDILTQPRAYPLLLSNLCYLWIPVLIYWRHIPDYFLRRTVAVIPVFFAFMFLVGNMWELRIYAELIPIVLSAFIIILKELLKKVST